MQRKKDAAVPHLNGYGPEKGIRRDIAFEVNGYAPEKSRFNSQFVHLFILFTGERTSNRGIFMPYWGLEDPSESERVWGGLRIKTRPPSSKHRCTQVFSEVEGGLGLKIKNSCFSEFRASPKEGKGKNDIRKIRKQPVCFHEQLVYFHERPVYFRKQPLYAKNPLKLVTFSGRLRLFYKLFCIFAPIIENIPLMSTLMNQQIVIITATDNS